MMRHKTRVVAVLGVVVLWALSGLAQSPISAAEAKNQVGKRATVCGEVASTHYAERSRGNPTFINLDKPYPDQIFTVLIWGSDRAKFGDPEETYRNKRICATGKITDYKGVPEIVAYEPSQIKIQSSRQ
jgi:micrococcal nuclease